MAASEVQLASFILSIISFVISLCLSITLIICAILVNKYPNHQYNPARKRRHYLLTKYVLFWMLSISLFSFSLILYFNDIDSSTVPQWHCILTSFLSQFSLCSLSIWCLFTVYILWTHSHSPFHQKNQTLVGSKGREDTITFTKNPQETHKLRLLSNSDKSQPLRYKSSGNDSYQYNGEEPDSSFHHSLSTPQIPLHSVYRHHIFAWLLILILTFYPFILNVIQYPNRSASNNACWITSDEDDDSVFGLTFYWLLFAVILFLSLFLLHIPCTSFRSKVDTQNSRLNSLRSYLFIILLYIVCMLLPCIDGFRSLTLDNVRTDDGLHFASNIALSLYGVLTAITWFNHRITKQLFFDILSLDCEYSRYQLIRHDPPSVVRSVLEIYRLAISMVFHCRASTLSDAEEKQKRFIREILTLNPAPREDSDLMTHPHDDTNLFTEYTYCYQFPLMYKGTKKVIELTDLSAAPRILQMDTVYEKFLRCVVPRARPHCTFTFDVLRTLIAFNKEMIITIVTANCGSELCEIGGVIAFRELLNFLYTNDPLYFGLIFAGIIAVSKLFAYIFTARGWVVGDRAGIGARNLLMGLILRKSLLIPQYDLGLNNDSTANSPKSGDSKNGDKSKPTLSTGQIVNTMSNDTERINNLFKMGVVALACGVNIFICLSFMIWLIGWEALGGFAIGILLVPFNIYFGKFIGSKKLDALVFSDERVKFLTELLNGIRVVKMYCWEQPLQETIAKWRREEIDGFRTVYNARALLTAALAYCDYVIVVTILGIKVAFGKPINVVEVYLVISLTNTIRSALNKVAYVGQFIDGLVAILRIQAFFDIEDHYEDRRERQKQQQNGFDSLNGVNGVNGVDAVNGHKNGYHEEETEEKEDGDILMEIKNAKFEHEPHLALNRLHVDQLEIHQNELVAVIGSVGSGKSMLMESLLLETFYEKDNGGDSVFRFGQNSMKFAWVNQSFFIMNGTIRENIVMDNAFDADDYNAVIEASSLRYDLKLFAAGDQTEIGEKGINLSGGQRARVCIARALYEQRHNGDVDVMLFDDSLSAVDNDVAQQIFSNAILKMAANTTRVVIMNSHLHFLEHFDRIIVMEYVDDEGYCRVAENTTNLDLLRVKYAGLLQESVQKEEARKRREEEEMEAQREAQHEVVESVEAERIRQDIVRKTSMYDEADGEGSMMGSLMDMDIDEMQRKKQEGINKDEFAKMAKLIQAEDRVRGALEGSSLIEYLQNGSTFFDNGIIVFVLLTIFFMLTQCISVAFDISLSWWGSAGDPDSTSDSNWDPWFDPESLSDSQWLLSSAIFVVVILFVGVIRAIMLFNIALTASQSFEQGILYRVLHATIAYFDATPIGRITNRFSRDLAIIDSEMPVTMEMIALRMSIFASYVVILSIFIPYYLIIVFPSLYLIVKLRGFYIKSVREIKRIDGITRSPLYKLSH